MKIIKKIYNKNFCPFNPAIKQPLILHAAQISIITLIKLPNAPQPAEQLEQLISKPN